MLGLNIKLRVIGATLLTVVLLSGCNVTKHLKDNETLYTGGKVKIRTLRKVPDKKDVKQQLEELFPKQNFKVLGMRPKLWIYYKVGPVNKEKGFKHWLRNKFGEPPVLYEDINTEKIENRMLSVLYNQGYFQAEIEFEEKRKSKKVSLEYTATINSPYKIKEIFYPEVKTQFDSQLLTLKEKTVLKPGTQYKLDYLEEERSRIDEALKDRGYYFFNPEFLIFKADSTVGDRTVNLYLELKPDVPAKGLRVYRINSVSLNPDYRPQDSLRQGITVVRVDSINFMKRGNGLFRPKSLTRLVFLRPDSIYSRKRHNITLNRLMGLDVFKYVNIKFREVDSLSIGEQGRLNARIQMSPLLKKSLQTEVQAFTKSTSFAGPAVIFSFRNRNALRGAELLVVNLGGSFETQISQQFKGFPAYEFQANTQLYLPRFFTPPFEIQNNSLYLPRTRIQLGYQIQNRINWFRQNSLNTSYGFIWKETKTREHELNPINISYLDFSDNRKRSADEPFTKFDSLMSLSRSLQNQFILGSNYSFTFNNLNDNTKSRKGHFYFNGNMDISGNVMYLIQRLIKQETPTDDAPFTIAGIRYAQYAKNDIDVRYYHDLSKTSRLATRLFAGVGYAYGNSRSLPFAKQYFSGGPNSIRAFRARSIGPGIFRDEDRSAFLSQLGDIRLEANAEYRFDIISIVKGAIFVDAGNTWLIRADTLKPGGKFDKSKFLSEIAIGTGFGLRFDVSFLVLRLDLGYPLRIPYLPKQERWILNDPDWKKRNPVLNIAIGYPF